MKNFHPLLIALLILTLAGLACGGTDGGTSTVKTATPESEEATAVPTEAPKPEAKLGDVTEQDGYTLSAVTVDDPAAPHEFLADLEPGTRLVGVEIIVGCTTCESASVNPLNATLVDADGFSYQVELGALADHDQIATVEIGPGEKVKGWVAFALPEGAAPAYLKWNAQTFTGPTLQVGVTK